MLDNALITEVWRGLGGFGRPQRAYLFSLALQALVMLIWWPDPDRLSADRGPATLFAVIIVLGITLSYHSIIGGAEELLLPGQHSLREWIIATRLPLWRILSGYFVSHVIQTLHWMLLSAPILLVAWSVDGSDWQSFMLCVLIIFVLACTYRFSGACVYLTVGHYRQTTWYSLRVILVLGFVAGGLFSPVTNFWVVTSELLDASHRDRQWSSISGFILIYGLWILLTGVAMVKQAMRIRYYSLQDKDADMVLPYRRSR